MVLLLAQEHPPYPHEGPRPCCSISAPAVKLCKRGGSSSAAKAAKGLKSWSPASPWSLGRSVRRSLSTSPARGWGSRRCYRYGLRTSWGFRAHLEAQRGHFCLCPRRRRRHRPNPVHSALPVPGRSVEPGNLLHASPARLQPPAPAATAASAAGFSLPPPIGQELRRSRQ